MLSTLKSISRAAVIALAVGGAVVTAVPAQAASLHYMAPGFGLGLSYPHRINPLLCYTDYQVRQALSRQGFSRIYLNAANGRFIEARATRGRWVYLIEFNRCSGNIVDVRRLRRAY